MRCATKVCCILSLVCAAASATAQTDDPLDAGRSCFEQLDFACAIDLLTAAIHHTPSNQIDRQVTIYRMLAESHLALGQAGQAVDAFEALLSVRPEFRIQAPGTSPKILDALAQARARLARQVEPPPPDPPLPQAPATPPRTIGLSFSGGAQFLVGDDSRLLDPGAVLDLDLIYRFSESWLMAGGLRWASHGLTNGESKLQLGGGWAGAGATIQLGRFRMAGLFGFGASRFGIWDREGRTALLLPLKIFAQVQVHERFELGLSFAPSWVLTTGDFLSSLTLDLSVRAAVLF